MFQMRYVGCFLLFVVMVQAQWSQQIRNRDPGRAMSCNSIECPRYRVISRFNGYELRRYEPSVWVATNTTTTIMGGEFASRGMFWKLFRYISGNNYGGMKIKMTAPVITKVDRPQCASCNSNHVMYFMVPAVHQGNPPIPMDKEVYLTPMPTTDVFVKYYGGRPNMNDKMQKLGDLQREIIGDANSYDQSHFYMAGYDSPWKRTNRHNEIWLQSTGRQISITP